MVMATTMASLVLLVLANTLVLLAACAVWALASAWPDIAAGAVICAVFLRSAIVVAREAGADLRRSREPEIPAKVSISVRR